MTSTKHPYIYHLVQAHLWERAVASQSSYYPPTYAKDGFTHGTANPDKLLDVANHFYTDVPGDWLCLTMTEASLAATNVSVIFEGTAAVGDKPPDFDGSQDELFPHLQGGIHPAAVLRTSRVTRTKEGRFLTTGL